MKYEELYKDFISIFPEDSDFFEEKSRENDAEESDGMHIMFWCFSNTWFHRPFLGCSLRNRVKEYWQ